MAAQLVLPSQAQTTTLRNPLIQGAPFTQAGAAASPGQPPPVGDGMTPQPVTPGMGGGPTHLPGIDRLPANQVNVNSSQVGVPIGAATLAPPQTLGQSINIPPPPSTPGADPGVLAPNNSGYTPPAAWVNINPAGGMPGDQAPKRKWGGQTTKDFGSKRGGSTLTDFGDPLQRKPDLKMQPQCSEDGPRQATYPGQMGSSNRAPNLRNAQTAQDLYGDHTLVKDGFGNYVQPRMTIAPY